MFEKFSSGAGNPQVVLEGLARGVDERRLLVHSFDEAEQERLAGSKIAGELPGSPTSRPQVGVYLNDGTGSKMSYYLDYDVAVRSEGCQDDAQRLAGEMTPVVEHRRRTSRTWGRRSPGPATRWCRAATSCSSRMSTDRSTAPSTR